MTVDVTFRFTDGVTVRETWDGSAEYRVYRFLRPAAIDEVQIDPEGRNALDPDPANNGLRRTPNEELSGDWGKWFGAVFQLVLEGASQWL